MTEQQQLLARIRSSIRGIESHIACAEKAMRQIPSMPVLDLEELRVLLWQLRLGEQLLLRTMANGVGKRSDFFHVLTHHFDATNKTLRVM